MSVSLIAIFAGFIVGSVSAGVIGVSALFSRRYRKENNRFAIHLTQAVAVTSILGSLLLIQILDGRLGIEHHSHPYYAIRWAYLITLMCAVFFILRADFRWQKLAGIDRKPN